MDAKFTMELTPTGLADLLKPVIEKETGRFVTKIDYVIIGGYEDRFHSQPPSLGVVKVTLGPTIDKSSKNRVSLEAQYNATEYYNK